MSPARMVVRRFFRSRLSMVGVVMLVALFAFSFIGPPALHMFGYQWAETDTDLTPTTKTATQLIEGVATDAEGNKHDVIQIVESQVGINYYAPSSPSHFLGTDEKGMDVFIRLMYGGRISLTLGFVVVILETIIGIIMGGIAGYFGGKADQIIMRLVDVLNCIPPSHTAYCVGRYRLVAGGELNANLLPDADDDYIRLERNSPYGKRSDTLPQRAAFSVYLPVLLTIVGGFFVAALVLYLFLK